MNTGHFSAALIVALCLSGGQLLFKKAALAIGEPGSLATVLKSVVFNQWLVAGLLLYLLTTLGWVLLLRSAPLSIVYPLTALSFLLVPLASHYLFGESYSWRLLVGGMLICSGIVLASLDATT